MDIKLRCHSIPKPLSTAHYGPITSQFPEPTDHYRHWRDRGLRLQHKSLDFSCTVIVLGKTAVGKSSQPTRYLIKWKFSTDVFDMGTEKVQDVTGTVQGIRFPVIDTPGLLISWTDQRLNEKILHSVNILSLSRPFGHAEQGSQRYTPSPNDC